MLTLKYYIKYLIILFSYNLFCQNEVKNDTINEYKYGFRVGIDISKQIRMFIEDNYKGVEFVGDYRLTKNLYLASEIGNENKLIDLDALKYNSSGTYIKFGIDYPENLTKFLGVSYKTTSNSLSKSIFFLNVFQIKMQIFSAEGITFLKYSTSMLRFL